MVALITVIYHEKQATRLLREICSLNAKLGFSPGNGDNIILVDLTGRAPRHKQMENSCIRVVKLAAGSVYNNPLNNLLQVINSSRGRLYAIVSLAGIAAWLPVSSTIIELTVLAKLLFLLNMLCGREGTTCLLLVEKKLQEKNIMLYNVVKAASKNIIILP